ncbi:MAG: RNA polymerase sigma factor [Bacteroidales bacterium]|nr:RNA polymerase sigma factor [Bacteroidales bacterium]
MNIVNSDNSEKQIINALIDGEDSAYRHIIAKYREPVVRLCRGFTGSADDAEDLAQDVFIEVFRSVGRFKGRSSLSTWIYRIAVNKSINFVRDRSKKNHDDYALTAEIEGRDNDDSADSRLMQKDHAMALHSAVERLPESQRTAFVLSKYEDMSYSEIAAIMKNSISSVESLLFRAKRNLQKHLYDYYEKNMQ